MELFPQNLMFDFWGYFRCTQDVPLWSDWWSHWGLDLETEIGLGNEYFCNAFTLLLWEFCRKSSLKFWTCSKFFCGDLHVKQLQDCRMFEGAWMIDGNLAYNIKKICTIIRIFHAVSWVRHRMRCSCASSASMSYYCHCATILRLSHANILQKSSNVEWYSYDMVQCSYESIVL